MEVQATFCFEHCDRGPTVRVGEQSSNIARLTRPARRSIGPWRRADTRAADSGGRWIGPLTHFGRTVPSGCKPSEVVQRPRSTLGSTDGASAMTENDAARQVVFTNKARCRDCYRCVRVCPGESHTDARRAGVCGRQPLHPMRHLRARMSTRGQIVPQRHGAGKTAICAGHHGCGKLRAFVCGGVSGVSTTAAGVRFAAARLRLRQRNGRWRVSRGSANRGPRRRAARSTPYLHVVPGRRAIRRTLSARVDLRLDAGRLADDRPRQTYSPATPRRSPRGRFIGPCVAKKAEAERPEYAGLVDCVVTFPELREWFAREAIDLSACEESDFDESPEGDARLFPIEGGSVRTSRVDHRFIGGRCRRGGRVWRSLHGPRRAR